MSKVDLVKAVKGAQLSLKKHSPEILTGLGIAGMITTVGLAVKATPKATLLIEEKKVEKGVDKLPPIEVVKTAWKPYIPTILTGTASILCLIGASSTNARRNAALATAYSLSETALRDYKEKVVETVGEKKEREVRDAIAKDQIEKDPLGTREVVITGVGDTLCYDALSGRYFYSDSDKIKNSINVINERLLDQSYVSLNDLYYELGLGGTTLGDELGWGISQGLIKVDFSSQLSDNDTPCLVMDYEHMPMYDFDRWI